MFKQVIAISACMMGTGCFGYAFSKSESSSNPAEPSSVVKSIPASVQQSTVLEPLTSIVAADSSITDDAVLMPALSVKIRRQLKPPPPAPKLAQWELEPCSGWGEINAKSKVRALCWKAVQ